jgi:hypothetical protein
MATSNGVAVPSATICVMMVRPFEGLRAALIFVEGRLPPSPSQLRRTRKPDTTEIFMKMLPATVAFRR